MSAAYRGTIASRGKYESETPAELDAVSVGVAGMVVLQREIQHGKIKVCTDVVFGLLEAFRAEQKAVGAAVHPHPADAGIRREHGEALRDRQLQAFGIEIEVVDAVEQEEGAAHRDSERDRAANKNGIADFGAPQADVAVRHGAV